MCVAKDTDSVHLPTVDASEFRHVVGHLTSGVSVITTSSGGRRSGMTASSVTSLSMNPPMMLVCIHQDAPTAKVVSESGRFAINVLSEEGADLAQQFATPSDDKFRGVSVREGRAKLPLLEEALAHLECEVIEEVVGGSHLIFLGRVVSAVAAGEGEPLAYYRGSFGRFEFAANDEAYRHLRSLIVERRYPANSELDPQELSRSLQVAPTAVFFSLTRLADDGLIRRDPERGYVVVALDYRLCDETFDARATIQSGVIKGRLDTVTAPQVEILRHQVAEMRRHIRDDAFTDFEAYLEANYLFHLGIVQLADNGALETAFKSLGLKGIMARSFGATAKTSSEFLSVQEEILAGIEGRDENGSISAIHRYSKMAKLRVREVLDEHGGTL